MENRGDGSFVITLVLIVIIALVAVDMFGDGGTIGPLFDFSQEIKVDPQIRFDPNMQIILPEGLQGGAEVIVTGGQ